MTERQMLEETIKVLEDIIEGQQELIGAYINNWTAAEEELAAMKVKEIVG